MKDNSKENEQKIRRRNIVIVILFIIILLLLCLLGWKLFGDQKSGDGEIDGDGNRPVATGNIDVFTIGCTCDLCQGENKTDANESTTGYPVDDNGVIVYDKYKIWDNRELRIFENPAYNNESKVAPGSSNSYTYIIKNDNSFDVVVDMTFVEQNDYDINMLFKLQNKGNYLVGDNNNYADIAGKTISQITIPARSEETFILDWKWVDSDNDTAAGFAATTGYELTINIGANQK